MAQNIRVTSWGDEVKQGMDTVVAEARLTPDTRLFGQNVIILALEVPYDFLETVGFSDEFRAIAFE